MRRYIGRCVLKQKVMRPDLLTLASNLVAREQRFALVTVVRREPPSSARVGDVAVVTETGDYYGWVGGGCTRSTVLREARRAIAAGEPRLLSLSPEPGEMQRSGMVALPMTCDSGGTVEIYVEPVLPVARLLLFGTSPAVRVLARIGHAMGYRVEVVDADADKASFPEAERVSQTIAADAVPRGAHVLVATMGERDLEAIEAVAGCAPAYLDIGARTPEEIALSIMAQIVERRRRAAEPAEAAPPREPALQAVDPVCGMSVAIAGARHTAQVRDTTYYFCCAGCRTKFLADSARYLAARAGAQGS